MWKIKKQLIEDICNSARFNYPREFLCFLSAENEIITEVVLLPNTSGETFAEINPTIIPIDNSIIGTIHSHPLGGNSPSKADKKFFSNYKINGIIDHTFNPTRIKFYDKNSKEINLIQE